LPVPTALELTLTRADEHLFAARTALRGAAALLAHWLRVQDRGDDAAPEEWVNVEVEPLSADALAGIEQLVSAARTDIEGAFALLDRLDIENPGADYLSRLEPWNAVSILARGVCQLLDRAIVSAVEELPPEAGAVVLASVRAMLQRAYAAELDTTPMRAH
jgi:hypothetical protein